MSGSIDLGKPVDLLLGLGAKPKPIPIASDVRTTLDRTVAPVPPGQNPPTPIDLCEISEYSKYGYGKWEDGLGLPYEYRRDLLKPITSTNKTGLLSFFTISDIHITDKESPNQVIFLQRLCPELLGTCGYSGMMLYTTHVLDAAVQTVNALHKKKPIDFGISLGDVCNSTQYNELRWFIDVMDGKVITPSSGKHHGEHDIDYQKRYQAAGLDIPWYSVLGNHDHFWMGVFPVDCSIRKDLKKSFTSSKVFATSGDILEHPDKFSTREYYVGVIDGSTPYGNIIKTGLVEESPGPTVVADPGRRSLSKKEWMNEFFNTSSLPSGHGFNQDDANAGFACYSFVPKSSIPLKVIVLDDTQTEDTGISIHGCGALDQRRWTWLKEELASGDKAQQLMVIAGHVPLKVELPGSQMGWWDNPQNAVTESDLISELHRHPNLLLWLSGHRHVNVVKAFVSPNREHPENGFWQVETGSLRDFPQQFRIFEICFNNDDSTISILTANVDPAVEKDTPAETSRKYAIATAQILEIPAQCNPTDDPTIKPMVNGSYNAELVKQLSPEMQAKMKNLTMPLSEHV